MTDSTLSGMETYLCFAGPKKILTEARAVICPETGLLQI